jgi:hypothetical protein
VFEEGRRMEHPVAAELAAKFVEKGRRGSSGAWEVAYKTTDTET